MDTWRTTSIRAISTTSPCGLTRDSPRCSRWDCWRPTACGSTPPTENLLRRLKADLAGQRPLTLQRLLAADQQVFLGADGARYYAYAWGVAYYLTFEKHALGSPAVDRYVQAAAKELPPTQRFEQLVGTRLDKFEAAWRQYILTLR